MKNSIEKYFCVSKKCSLNINWCNAGFAPKRVTCAIRYGVISISNGLIPTFYNPKITFVETSGCKVGKLVFKRMSECIAGSTFMQELTVDSILVEGG